MAGFFSRIFKVAQSEAHTAVSKFEDPIKMTEQGIRDLKSNLTDAMSSLAQVKASANRIKKDAEDEKRKAADYERKAMLLLKRAQAGEIEAGEADRLATEALGLKAEAANRAQSLGEQFSAQNNMAGELQSRVNTLKREIGRYENELVTLRARSKTATSMKKINQHLAGADSSSTVAMLERMRNKVEEEESLAEAYAQIGEDSASVDTQIDKALDAPSETAAADSLAELKRKMQLEA